MKVTENEVLRYHLGGKIGLDLIRELNSQKDLSIAYTPGVGKACQHIVANQNEVYRYTAKGNLVAVVTDGSSVLGFGDIGAKASIPVMEGKAVLFKAFADVDAWPVPLENMRVNGNVGKTDISKVVEATAAIAPMYGGINLEDIAAPACFEIERRLEEILDIPVFHDDQWGTAIITLAAVFNYCHLSKKMLEELAIVINGAGAAGIRIAEMLKASGAANVVLVDSKAVVHEGREDLNKYKKRHAVSTGKRSLTDAMEKADVFIGVSVRDCVTPDMIRSMNTFPAIFAMANPDPEILPEAVAGAMNGREYLMATGRSDYPNQINNVLGFPHIFRGALDVKARDITTNMKIAAAEALAIIPREGSVSEKIKKQYNRDAFSFGKDYFVPVPFDPAVCDFEANAVAKAALAEGNSRFAVTKEPEGLLSKANKKSLDGATIESFCYFNGNTYASLRINEKPVSVKMADNAKIDTNPSKPGGKATSVSLKTSIGEFYRLGAPLIGLKKIKETNLSSIDAVGRLCNISKESGWQFID